MDRDAGGTLENMQMKELVRQKMEREFEACIFSLSGFA